MFQHVEIGGRVRVLQMQQKGLFLSHIHGQHSDAIRICEDGRTVYEPSW